MTASALAMAAKKQFDAKDDLRLAFNTPITNPAARDMVHLYRVGHANPDPAANVASMKAAEALSVPVEERLQQVEATRVTQNEQGLRERQEQPRNQGAPRMTVCRALVCEDADDQRIAPCHP